MSLLKNNLYLAMFISSFGAAAAILAGLAALSVVQANSMPVRQIPEPRTPVGEVREIPEPRTPVGEVREITAYNVGDPSQTSGDPCQSANGENICAAVKAGLKRCAANFVPFGSRLYVAGHGECTVTDRMNRRYPNRVDIAMGVHEKEDALRFGLQKRRVIILESA